jgi:hypothetical protein
MRPPEGYQLGHCVSKNLDRERGNLKREPGAPTWSARTDRKPAFPQQVFSSRSAALSHFEPTVFPSRSPGHAGGRQPCPVLTDKKQERLAGRSPPAHSGRWGILKSRPPRTSPFVPKSPGPAGILRRKPISLRQIGNDSATSARRPATRRNVRLNIRSGRRPQRSDRG